MSKAVILLIVILLALAVTGCKTSSGSREYIPGKGWVPND
jgi:predicted small secreted protein